MQVELPQHVAWLDEYVPISFFLFFGGLFFSLIFFLAVILNLFLLMQIMNLLSPLLA